jgi:hypothetical protein
MRNTLAFILSVVLAVSLVAFGFTAFHVSAERDRLLDELEVLTAKRADEISGYLGTIN